MNNNLLVEKKFDEIADKYEFYKYTQLLRAKKIKNILNKHGLVTPNTRILDIGVAGGELAELYLSNQIFTGLDISSEMIKKAKKRIPDADFIKCDGENLFFKNNYFDLVVLSEVLFYMNNPIHCLLEVYRVLKPGKRLIIFSRNQFWHKFDWLRKLFGIGPSDDLVDKMYYEKEIVRMTSKAKFKEIKAETFCFVPFKKFMIFDKTPLKKYGHLIFLNAKK